MCVLPPFLGRPLPLETTASEEMIIIDNLAVFERNGFRFTVRICALAVTLFTCLEYIHQGSTLVERGVSSPRQEDVMLGHNDCTRAWAYPSQPSFVLLAQILSCPNSDGLRYTFCF